MVNSKTNSSYVFSKILSKRNTKKISVPMDTWLEAYKKRSNLSQIMKERWW